MNKEQQSPDGSQRAATGQIPRNERLSILAKAPLQDIWEKWKSLNIDPQCEILRGPETGLIALRGRIGGGGAPFNFGEATMTRATIRLESGAIGHAVMLGRNKSKAQLAAIIDALAEEADMIGKIESEILLPLKAEQAARDQEKRAETEATKVNFFTMVRGDN